MSKMLSIISKNIRVRHPKYFNVGNYSVVDDFSYFSTKVMIGNHCHVASGCSMAGGKDFQVTVGDYTSISSGVKLWCRSNDFINDLVILNPTSLDVRDNKIEGNILIGKMCGIGSNTVIMPDNTIPDGTVIGALSYVPPRFSFKPWSVYAGIPIRFIKKRNKQSVIKQVNLLQNSLRNGNK